jgi:hypothetical protein
MLQQKKGEKEPSSNNLGVEMCPRVYRITILWRHKEISFVVGMMTSKASPSLPRVKSPHF